MSSKSISLQYKKLKEDLKNGVLLINTELDLDKQKYINFKTGFAKLKQNFGKDRLFSKDQAYNIRIMASSILLRILELEKKRRINGVPLPEHLTLRKIHGIESLKTTAFSIIVIYILPFCFLINSTNMKKIGPARICFAIPFILAFQYMRNYINHYVINKNAIKMLYCLDQYYSYDEEIFSIYEKFMQGNKLKFIKKKQATAPPNLNKSI